MSGGDGRPEPPQTADEAATLRGFLEFHRATLRWKTDGLDAEALGRTLAPSSMTLGGMLKHLAYVEGYWFCEILLGEPQPAPFTDAPWRAQPDWDWDSAADDSPEGLRALHQGAVARSNRITDRLLAAGGLDTVSRRPGRSGEPFTLRWVLVHLVEEYARHNGHADLIRQSIDGLTGE